MTSGPSLEKTQAFIQEDLTSQQILIIAYKSIRRLGWELESISNNAIIANTKKLYSNVCESISIEIHGHKVLVRSTYVSGPEDHGERNMNNTQGFINAFHIEKAQTSREEFALQIALLEKGEFPPPEVENEEDLEQDNVKLGFKDYINFLTPQKGYYITPILIYINVLIFIIMAATGVHLMKPDGQSLIAWGANFKPLTLEGEWWRLITCCFLHIGLIHLLFNMYALLYIGLFVESKIGPVRFLAAYLLTGICSSILSLAYHDFTISAGASGAIFGMYGVFLALLTTNLIEASVRKQMFTSIGIFVAFNLIYGMQEGIDNAGHIGGLIGGFVIGYALYPSLKRPESSSIKYGTIAALTILVMGVSTYAYQNLPNDALRYDTAMSEFATIEGRALEVFDKFGESETEELLVSLKDSGIVYWEQGIEIMDELSEIDFPEPLQSNVRTLRDYCELRKKSYQMMVREIESGTNDYSDSIEIYNEQISELIKQLN